LGFIQHTLNDTFQNTDRANFVINPFETIPCIGGMNDNIRIIGNCGYNDAVSTSYVMLCKNASDTWYSNFSSRVYFQSDSSRDISTSDGAFKITIKGWDNGGLWATEEVSTNGTVETSTSTLFGTCFATAYVSNGNVSNTTNVGNISFRYGSGGPITGYIRASECVFDTAGVAFIISSFVTGYAVVKSFGFTTDTTSTYIRLMYYDCTTMVGATKSTTAQIIFQGKFAAGTYNFDNYPIGKTLAGNGKVYLVAKTSSGTAYVSGYVNIVHVITS
jgi:hypothetical protein